MGKNARKCFLTLLSSVVLLASLFGCAASNAERAEIPTGVTDQLGRPVTLDGIPQRVISLAPSNTEILFALGLADKVVAVTDYCNYPPEVEEKPSIGGFTTPNIEEIIALSPDLILATAIHEKRILPQLEAHGLTVFVLAPKTLDEVLESIALVGEVTSTEKNASELVAEMQKRIEAVTGKVDAIPEVQKPTVFYLTWHDPLKTSGAGTLHNELIQQAGGRNVFPEVTGTQSVDFELLVSRNPQIMIAGIGMGSGEDRTFQYLKTEARLKNTEAGKNGSIYKIDLDLTGRVGPRIVEGLEQFAKCIHPEIFGTPVN